MLDVKERRFNGSGVDVVVNCWEAGESMVAAVYSRCGSGGEQESIGKEAGLILSVILSENIIKCV